MPARGIVPGDIIHLRTGDKIPADGRLLESFNLKIDEATLTGESLPVEKQTGPLASGTTCNDFATAATVPAYAHRCHPITGLTPPGASYTRTSIVPQKNLPSNRPW